MKPAADETELEATQAGITEPNTDDPRLLAAVKEYMAAVDAGRRPLRQEFIARHPEIADELSACLQGLAFVNSAAAQVNGIDALNNAAELTSGRPLGDFKLLREIGRGGMGVVYEATQLSLGRRVAVKVLPLAAAFDPRHLQRFKNEAQAAAQLHHTNIVPVYAVGSERSVHYYAMQLIDGQSLAVVIDELRRARSGAPGDFEPSDEKPVAPVQWPPSSAGVASARHTAARFSTPRQALDEAAMAPARLAGHLTTLHSAKRTEYFRAVARLGLQAAEALFYAHQQGVVHRDIKPANLLLDTQGTLWITDFGLAQMYADTGLTQTGDLVGTFRYMSPEQASGRAVVLDERTDIYSLGITLYEMLTLERALPGQTREELLHQIASVDPRLPRLIDRKIPIELETIIGKATSKDPAERYISACAMADDLQRFLDDKPVLARRPSLVNQAVKWTRRHKTIATCAGVILILAAIGSTISSVLIAREQSKTTAAYRREQRRTVEATDQRRLAEKSFEQAREAVDAFTSMAIKEMPTDPKFFQVRWRMLETSLSYYQSFLDQQKNDPSLAAQLSEAESQVSTVLAELAAVDELLRTNFQIRLLAERSIQEDLALVPQQVTEAANLAVQVGSKPPGVKPDSVTTSQQMREMISQDAAEREAALAAVLTPAQSRRLREISRQIRGVFAFSDADVAAALALTPEQKNAVRSACADFHNHHHHGPGRNDAGDSEHAAMQKIVDRTLSCFTAQQVEAWKGLTGQPYVGNVPRYESWFSPDHHDHGPFGPGGPDGGPHGNHGFHDGPPDGFGKHDH